MKVNDLFNSVTYIAIGPFEWTCGFIVVTNVLHDLACKVCFGGEDASGNKVSLNFGEPDFDLIEPGARGRSVVHSHVAVLGQEGSDPLGFVSGKIVSDNMNLPALGLAGNQVGKERHEFSAGVTGCSLAHHASTEGVQSRIKRECSMPEVFETVAFGPSRREGQDRIEPVQRLDRGLFVYTEDRSVGRRLEVQANDLGCFGLEIRIVAGFVTTQPVGLQPRLGPDARHSHVGDAKFIGQPAGAPVCRAIWRFTMQCPVHDAGFEFFGAGFGLTTFMATVQTTEAFVAETLAPKPDRVDATVQIPANLPKTQPLGQIQNDTGATRILGASFAAPGKPIEFSALWRANNQTGVHACHSTAGVSEVNVTVY